MSLYQSGFSLEKQKEIEINFKELQLWGLASLKSVRQASRLEIQPEVDVGI